MADGRFRYRKIADIPVENLTDEAKSLHAGLFHMTRNYNFALARFYGRALLLTAVSPFVNSARKQELLNEHWNKLERAQGALMAVEDQIYRMVGYGGTPSDERYAALVVKSHKEEYKERLKRISFGMHPAIVAKRGRFEIQLPKWARDELKEQCIAPNSNPYF